VIVTDAAKEFVTDSAIAANADFYWWQDYKRAPGLISHIEATDDLDMLLICPATANTIAKIAYGIAGNVLTSAILATDVNVTKVIAPAMNTRMWKNPVVERNVGLVRDLDWKILEPVRGRLACGTEGEGKLPSTRDIVAWVNEQRGWVV